MDMTMKEVNEFLERKCAGMEEITCGLRNSTGTLDDEDLTELVERAYQVIELVSRARNILGKVEV